MVLEDVPCEVQILSFRSCIKQSETPTTGSIHKPLLKWAENRSPAKRMMRLFFGAEAVN